MRRRLAVHLGALGASMAVVLSLATVAAGREPGPAVRQQADLQGLDQTLVSVQQRQADLADDLDVLHASSDEVAASLDAISANVAAQQQLTDRATSAADEARQAWSAALAEVQRKQADVDVLESILQQMAVSLYTRPPLDDTVQALVTISPNDAPAALALARFRVEDVAGVLRANRAALAALAEAELTAERSRTVAERTEAAEKGKLAELETARIQQHNFATEVSDRIERAMSEAAGLRGRDAELSAQIQARELALAARLRDSLTRGTPPGVDPDPDPDDDGSGTSGGGAPLPVTTTTSLPPSGGGGGSGPTTTTVPPPGPTTTTTPPSTTTTIRVVIPPIVITPVDTTWVSGVEVATSIADRYAAMVAAAAAEGISLEGYGYRNILEQIAIRREICGPTDYDIYVKPSWECSPPVAIPGRSMHERGLAIDFTEAGFLIRTRSHPVIEWLTVHAAAYGFYNLPSEPWHWSTTGG